MYKRGMLIVFFLAVFSCSALAIFECRVTTDTCNITINEHKIMRMSNYTNAHVELYYLSNPDYNWNLCCTDVSAFAGSTVILRTNLTTNSHVELANASSIDYSNAIGMLSAVSYNSIVCNYTSGSCASVGGECAITVEAADPSYPDTNMHVASCNSTQEPYTNKICCHLESNPEYVVIPEFSTIGMILSVIIIGISFVYIRKKRGLKLAKKSSKKKKQRKSKRI